MRQVQLLLQVGPVTQGLIRVIQGLISCAFQLIHVARHNLGSLKNILVGLLHCSQQPSSCLLAHLGSLVLCCDVLLRGLCTTVRPLNEG